jgi:hypothetical protein
VLTILFLSAMAVVGWVVADHVLPLSADRASPLQRAAASGICALAAAVAVSWTLALLKILTGAALLASAAAALAAGVWFLLRRRRFRSLPSGRRLSPRIALAAAAVLPVLLWFAFALYRGYRLPVANFDALSYHLPKSVFLMKSHGYRYLNLPDYRLNYPCNYELLLADSLVLEGSDHMTGPVSTLLFALFLLLAAALAEQWWGRDPLVIATVTLLVAAIPVLLLHSSAHKNDLLMSVCLLSGFLWLGRWQSKRDPFGLGLTMVSFALALGTKGHAIFGAAAALAVMLAGWLREEKLGARITLRQAGVLALAGIAAALLLGGVPYVVNLTMTGSPFAFPRDAIQQPGYGDWSNLATFTLLLAFVPFSPNAVTVFVPWRGQDWFWPKYDLYFSSFGAHWIFALLILLTFVFDVRARRAFLAVPRGTLFAGLGAFAGWLAMVPMRLRPIGHFAGFPRSMMFVTPFVIAALVGALLSSRSALTTARPRNRTLMLAFALVFFVCQALVCATDDAYGPLSALPTFGGTRRIYFTDFHGFNRAPHLLDRIAGDRDVVAVDAGLFTWLYPLWGAHFTRTVQIVTDSRPESIRPDARWVVVDRTVGVDGWDNPDFHDMSEFLRTVKRCPRPEESLLLERLENDPRFQRVYYDPPGNQAIFARR